MAVYVWRRRQRTKRRQVPIVHGSTGWGAVATSIGPIANRVDCGETAGVVDRAITDTGIMHVDIEGEGVRGWSIVVIEL